MAVTDDAVVLTGIVAAGEGAGAGAGATYRGACGGVDLSRGPAERALNRAPRRQ